MVQAIQPPTEENSTTQHHQKDLMWPMQHPCQQFEISLRKQTAKITENHLKMEPKIFKNASKIEFMRLPRASCEPTCSRTRFGIEFGCHLDASWGRPGDLLGTILVSFWRRFLKTVFDTSPKLNFHRFGMHFGFHFGINFAAICKHIPVMAKCTKRCK